MTSPSVRPDPSWMADAACRGSDPELFFPARETPGGVGPDAYDEARAICADCEVRDDCLEYALANSERFGMWGGLTQSDLRRLRRERQGDPIPHGTVTGYKVHDCRCGDCRAAWAIEKRWQRQRGVA